MASQSYTVLQRRRGASIIDRRVEKSNVNLKMENTALKSENQNLRREIIELQWQKYELNRKILAALGESGEASEISEGFF